MPADILIEVGCQWLGSYSDPHAGRGDAVLGHAACLYSNH